MPEVAEHWIAAISADGKAYGAVDGDAWRRERPLVIPLAPPPERTIQVFDLLLNAINDRSRVLAKPHHHDAAHCFAPGSAPPLFAYQSTTIICARTSFGSFLSPEIEREGMWWNLS